MPYIVDVSAPLPDDLEPVVEVIARAFDITPEKAARLVARAPGAITRPVGEREARAVAQVVAAAGLEVAVREVDAAEDRAGGASRAEAGATAVSAPDDTRTAGDRSIADGNEGADARSPARAADPIAADPIAAEREPDEASPATAVAEETEAPQAPDAAMAADPEPRPAATPEAQPTVPRAAGRGRVVAAAVLPLVAALLVALGAVIGVLYPGWRSDEAAAAAREARALAIAVEAAVDAAGVSIDGAASPVDALTAGDARLALAGPVRLSRRALEPAGYAFVLVVAPDGERLAGWPTSRDLVPALADAARRVARGATVESAPAPWGLDAVVAVEASTRISAPDGLVELAAAPIARDGSVVGHVVLGAPGGAADARLRLAILLTAGAGVVLVLVAIGIGAALGRPRPR